MTGCRLLFSSLLFIVFTYLNVAHPSLEPRLIVKYKEVSESSSIGSMNARSARQEKRRFVKLEKGLDKEAIKQKIQKIKEEDQDIEFVEVDTVMTIALNPGDSSGSRDTYYDSQWPLFDGPGGISMQSAWNWTTGNASTVVAVIDTGILAHEDLSGRVLPGADVISNAAIANDGGGRDNDPTDTGDFVSYGDPCYEGAFKASTWHGTHVAGTILANAGNGQGIAGINWRAKLLPVRALGKCGGYSSDIADGIRWAVGMSISGVSVNKNPAKVINLSLGGRGDCGTDMQNAISEARNRGAVVVVASGNDGAALDYNSYTPANCRGVIVVGATNSNGDRASYSNYGSKVDISAPGGDAYGGVLSLSNTGSTYAVQNNYKEMNGTSMATPHVAGVASLILGMKPGLYPDQVKDILKKSARSFSYYGCPTGGCGEGLLDAEMALRIASSTEPDSSFRVVEPITSGSGGTDGMISAQESSGGMCGTVDFNGGDQDGGGSKGPFIFTLFFMLAMMIKFQLKTTGVKAFSPFRT